VSGYFIQEGQIVRSLLTFVAVGVLAVSVLAVKAAQQPAPASASAARTTPATIDEVLMAVRADLQESRADILAKNMTLTAEQASKFWPMYDAYQKEQNVIMDDQMKGIQRYVDSFNTLDDAGAMGLITAHFDRDGRMNALRQKWFPEFRKVLPTKLAVRAMQIDRRLSLVHQVEFASRIPLAH